MGDYINQNGERVSNIPTKIFGTVANCASVDKTFEAGGPYAIIPLNTGNIEVLDASGNTAILAVAAEQIGRMIPVQCYGTKAAGTTLTSYTYWQ